MGRFVRMIDVFRRWQGCVTEVLKERSELSDLA